jgi:hypothetical protein
MKTLEIILLGYAICIAYVSIWLIVTKRTKDEKFSWVLLAVLISPVIVLYNLWEIVKHNTSLKLYKTYFDKSDTPYVQTFQPNRKYHVVWKRCAYTMFLKHQVVKVKFLGLFTIYNKQEANPNANN